MGLETPELPSESVRRHKKAQGTWHPDCFSFRLSMQQVLGCDSAVLEKDAGESFDKMFYPVAKKYLAQSPLLLQLRDK